MNGDSAGYGGLKMSTTSVPNRSAIWARISSELILPPRSQHMTLAQVRV